LRFLDNTAGLLNLFDSRHQRRAVLQSPAVILHVGDFQPVGVEIDSHLDDVGQLKKILPMHDRVDRQWQVQFTRPLGDLDFLCVSAFEAGNAVGDDRLVALKADLHVTQPGIGQRTNSILGQQHRGSDEI